MAFLPLASSVYAPIIQQVCQEKIMSLIKILFLMLSSPPENRIFLSRGVFASPKQNDEHYNSFHHQPKERKLAKIL
jgi:hypothetical protein